MGMKRKQPPNSAPMRTGIPLSVFAHKVSDSDEKEIVHSNQNCDSSATKDRLEAEEENKRLEEERLMVEKQREEDERKRMEEERLKQEKELKKLEDERKQKELEKKRLEQEELTKKR